VVVAVPVQVVEVEVAEVAAAVGPGEQSHSFLHIIFPTTRISRRIIPCHNPLPRTFSIQIPPFEFRLTRPNFHTLPMLQIVQNTPFISLPRPPYILSHPVPHIPRPAARINTAILLVISALPECLIVAPEAGKMTAVCPSHCSGAVSHAT
jgi:hypothetical protein